MQTWDMCHSKAVSGYTLIEILVVLVIVGLLASMTVPGLFQWIESRERAVVRNELQSRLMQLPLQSRLTNSQIIIRTASELDMPDQGVSVVSPIRVLANGYCIGGAVSLEQGAGVATYSVLAPFCELSSEAES